MAATRGRLMENLAAHVQPGQTAFADHAFMVGIMSLMPALIGLPLPDIVAPLGLADNVREALCQQGGELGDLLQLTEKSEDGDLVAMSAVLAKLPALSPRRLNLAQTDALSWANSIARDCAGAH